MTTFNLQKDFFNIKSGKSNYQMFFPDEFKQPWLPPVEEAYEYMKSWGASSEEIIKRLIQHYIPFRLVKGNHLLKRTLVTGLIGARGSGKSCSASEIILFDYLIRGWKVWSNMEISATFKYKDAEQTFTTLDFDKMDLFRLDLGFQGGCIYLDEVNLEYAESRRSTSNRNLKFTNMLQQLRHRCLDLVFTSQLDTFLDTRLRFQTDLFCICKDTALTPSGREYGADIGNFTFLDVFDYSGVYTGEIYHSGDKPLWTGILWIKPFWNTYNTYQMQGMDGGPDIGWQIKESERLTLLKAKQDKVDVVLSAARKEGVEKVNAETMMTMAGAKTRGERTSFGMQLAERGIKKEGDGFGGWQYIIGS